MRTCWHEDPANRPTFSIIVQTTSQIQESLNHSPVLPSSTPMPSAKPIMSKVPSERQHAKEHHPPHGREGLTVKYNWKALPYSHSDHKYINVPTVTFVRGEFPVPRRPCTPLRTQKPELDSEEIPKRGIITPHSSEHSHQNAPIVPPKPGVIVAAATAGKPKRGVTARLSGEPPSADRGGKMLRHNLGVGSATNKPSSPLEVSTKSNNYETIARDPYESAANYETIARDPYESIASYETISKDPYKSIASYETISKDPYESIASPYESISESLYDTIVPPTTSSFPNAHHDIDGEVDENTIGLNDDTPNDPVQPLDTTTCTSANLEDC